MGIVTEEAPWCLDGMKTAEDVAAIIQVKSTNAY